MSISENVGFIHIFINPVAEYADDVQIGIFSNLLRVSVALLNSDYEHEYRAGLKIISRLNSTVPLKHIGMVV